MTFTEAWNAKFQEFVDGEKGVARVIEHRTISEDTEIYCLAMEDKSYQVRIYSKGKVKIHSKHDKSTEAVTSYRELRDEMKPAPKEKPAKKATKKAAAKKPAAKKGAKKPAKKASKGKKEAVEPGDGFWDGEKEE